ncbi:MAG: hypothetical protein A3F16_06385 [Deltaproteobacteria bacterium RIFCSPHIGHO2_12_FULL_43_9]|nr:MAG: hypothetical protein A3F16_06385 [Deltaproteobacteria bacterium RIFCSPHIGHO2_12_FULL_43_9]
MKYILLHLVILPCLIYSSYSFSEGQEFQTKATQKTIAEVQKLFEDGNKKYGIKNLLKKKGISKKVRGVQYYRYSISEGWPSFPIDELRKKGALPYYVEGDFDCDGKLDKALIVESSRQSNSEILIFVSNKNKTIIEKEAPDFILLKKKGKYKTAKGKGYGSLDDPGPTEFTSNCDFIEGVWSEKSSFALVYDIKNETIIKYWISD